MQQALSQDEEALGRTRTSPLNTVNNLDSRCRVHRKLWPFEVSIGKVQGSSFWKQAKGQDLLPKDLITAGTHHVLHNQQAVTPDSVLAITGDNAGTL
jgi:hypothetical protein